MKCFVGIDLGSTTTKAVLLDEERRTLGEGITNSRSNYATATKVAKLEALISARLNLFRRALGAGQESESFLDEMVRNFRHEQFLEQLEDLHRTCAGHVTTDRFPETAPAVRETLDVVFERLRADSTEIFAPGAARKSDFFRDIAGSRFMRLGEEIAIEAGLPYENLLNLYDKSIIEVENRPPSENLAANFQRALDAVIADAPQFNIEADTAKTAMAQVLGVELEETYTVGTGYGRVTLPFDKDHIRSEILCHGLGAHVMYPETRTVLDIGGQDTKAIQVDDAGIVENFQMNDRCAAGCGRYLGYIADEMNMGLHELGPLAIKATKNVRINSTCTVFAGAELRDRLALGEAREDILAGLHRAIILRAMSIISRSGGIKDQFTFTGGVANNEAAVEALKTVIEENYGKMTINIDPASIYTGALGAATFAHRAVLN